MAKKQKDKKIKKFGGSLTFDKKSGTLRECGTQFVTTTNCSNGVSLFEKRRKTVVMPKNLVAGNNVKILSTSNCIFIDALPPNTINTADNCIGNEVIQLLDPPNPIPPAPAVVKSLIEGEYILIEEDDNCVTIDSVAPGTIQITSAIGCDDDAKAFISPEENAPGGSLITVRRLAATAPVQLITAGTNCLSLTYENTYLSIYSPMALHTFDGKTNESFLYFSATADTSSNRPLYRAATILINNNFVFDNSKRRTFRPAAGWPAGSVWEFTYNFIFDVCATCAFNKLKAIEVSIKSENQKEELDSGKSFLDTQIGPNRPPYASVSFLHFFKSFDDNHYGIYLKGFAKINSFVRYVNVTVKRIS